MKKVILVEFRKFSQILTLFNSDNFQVMDRKTWWRNFSIAASFLISLAFIFFLLVSVVWYCFDCGFAISETAFAVPVILVIFQVIGTYISMALENRKIAQVIDHLEEIINKRKILFAQLFALDGVLLVFLCYCHRKKVIRRS